MSISINTDSLVLKKAHSNTDYYYGPWDFSSQDLTLEEAVPLSKRKQGLTIGIIEGGEVVEYQWKTEDLSDEGLVEKKILHKFCI